MSGTEDRLLIKHEQITERVQQLEKQLEDQATMSHHEKLAGVTREYRHLKSILEKLEVYKGVTEKIVEDEEILKESSDPELNELAKAELEENQVEKDALEKEIKVLLIPTDPQDEKNAIMEIRAGTGGEEAALFAGDLYRMYTKYIEDQGWKKETLGSNPTQLGGFKEIVFAVSGENAYGKLKFESGVHRVQRVPETETGGRIHTSAASVVVLPEVEEVEIGIDPADLRVDVYRSSGPGGQSVNTTDSAVRITHVPTGLVVTCQDEKSQHKNKSKAMKVLRARLYDLKRGEEEKKLAAHRRSMIGSGDRSAKIRTFNFPQGRVTDHRINLTLYRLDEILAGDLNEVIGQLQIADRDEKLKQET